MSGSERSFIKRGECQEFSVRGKGIVALRWPLGRECGHCASRKGSWRRGFFRLGGGFTDADPLSSVCPSSLVVLTDDCSSARLAIVRCT